TAQFVDFLQSCITPVALISGVGLLLLTFTNRLARTIDRTRHLISELTTGAVKNTSVKKEEIKILYKRSRVLRFSIGSMVVSVIASSLIIPLLFLMFLLETNLRIIGYSLFVLSIISILFSCIYFFRDILLSLKALNLEAMDYISK
ncbi:MAG: DUF2721 domain-containing protein, partial [Bacteroidales bacterium]|nr:DUF2721 domain-containing protein [Bacteroidales bacterium]